MEAEKVEIYKKSFKLFMPEEQIQIRIRALATAINQDLKADNPLFLAILNGSFMFAADLFRWITIPAEISFIKLASYKGTRSTGRVVTSIGLENDMYDRTVVILEDIVDTGKTLHEFLPQIKHRQPRKLLITSLLSKPDARNYPIKIDYLGFDIPDKFIVGYGLDYDGQGRNLRHIYQLEE